MNFSHQAIWAAIDGLALRYAHSPSGLAKRAGLNATTFNKSKRFTTGGRERWPSTESIAKILEATGAGFEEFIALMVEANPSKDLIGQVLSLIDMNEACSLDVIGASGHVLAGDWDQIRFPGIRDEAAFALEVVDKEYEPVYWPGDIVIVSPDSEVRPGDRVAVKLPNGDVVLRQLRRQTATRIELANLQKYDCYQVYDESYVAWMSRVVWVKQ